MYNRSILCEMPQYPTEVVVSHEQGDNAGVSSPLKVSEVSYHVYYRTPATHLNHDQEHQCLAQQGYESRLEQVWAVMSWSLVHPYLEV